MHTDFAIMAFISPQIYLQQLKNDISSQTWYKYDIEK